MNTQKWLKFLRYLKVQVTLYYLVTSLVLIVLLGVILYYSISSITLGNELKNTVTAVERSGNYIEVYIEKLKALSTVLAQSPDTQAYLSTHDSESRGRLVRLIDTALSTDASLVSAIIVGKEGVVVSNEKELDMTVSDDMMKEGWYVEAVNSHSMPVLTAARQQKFSMDKTTWVISISQEITNDKGENAGVVLLDIRYQVIEDYLSDLNLGSKGYAYIINAQNRAVYHPDTTYFENPVKAEELLKIGQMPNGYDASMGMLTHHYAIEGTDWMLVGISSLDDLGNIRRQMIETVTLAGVVLFVIVMGSGVFIAGRITQPILALEQAMQHIDQGFVPVEIGSKGCYEVASLARHYNAMLSQIQKLMDAVKEKEQYLKTSEIKALQGQINPHFLYNTLDTIVWMAEFNDSEKVIAVTKALAQFFRISLSNGNEQITLGEELEHVKQYLFIQKQRYQEKLMDRFEIDESLLGQKVPKIILQPLVENAIYHGIREKEKGGCVEIKVTQEDNRVVISINDDGVGFEVIEKKNQAIKLGGVGIENVNQRIKLYCGEQYGVEVRSQKGQGTQVRVSLPKG